MTAKTLKALEDIEAEMRYEAKNRGDLSRLRLHEWADRIAVALEHDAKAAKRRHAREATS